ncbi:MAG: M48 family metallopeptidase [Planctomycetes bacterium]|nr:M48 family metallopeptidase [Planctomycetota bacterium]
MPEIDLNGRRVAFELYRSTRARHVSAQVRLHRGLRVTLPAQMDEARVAPFLRAHRRWILRTLDRFERMARVVPDRRLIHGAKVPYLGRELALDLNVGPERVGRLGDALVVHVPRRAEGTVRRALERWYRAEAERVFTDRVNAMAVAHGIRYRTLRVRDLKSRWGSCAASGALSFNWRLVLAPMEIVDYLIAHELAHFAELNHSPRFWAAVGRLCPSYRDQERWLRKFGRSLVL